MSNKNNKEKPVCRFFNSTHGCNKGAECEFIHPKPKKEENKAKEKPPQQEKKAGKIL